MNKSQQECLAEMSDCELQLLPPTVHPISACLFIVCEIPFCPQRACSGDSHNRPVLLCDFPLTTLPIQTNFCPLVIIGLLPPPLLCHLLVVRCDFALSSFSSFSPTITPFCNAPPQNSFSKVLQTRPQRLAPSATHRRVVLVTAVVHSQSGQGSSYT